MVNNRKDNDSVVEFKLFISEPDLALPFILDPNLDLDRTCLQKDAIDARHYVSVLYL
jgi:hypothetical protein